MSHGVAIGMSLWAIEADKRSDGDLICRCVANGTLIDGPGPNENSRFSSEKRMDSVRQSRDKECKKWNETSEGSTKS